MHQLKMVKARKESLVDKIKPNGSIIKSKSYNAEIVNSLEKYSPEMSEQKTYQSVEVSATTTTTKKVNFRSKSVKLPADGHRTYKQITLKKVTLQLMHSSHKIRF